MLLMLFERQNNGRLVCSESVCIVACQNDELVCRVSKLEDQSLSDTTEHLHETEVQLPKGPLIAQA